MMTQTNTLAAGENMFILIYFPRKRKLCKCSGFKVAFLPIENENIFNLV